MSERRVILLGKTGNGKSSTGNSILGNVAFKHMKDLCSVTQCNKIKARINPFNNLKYTVCDTPGLLDTDGNLLGRLLEVHKAEEICKEPHAFLLVFSSCSRFSEDEQHAVDIIRILFGEKVFDHCIIVFTRGNEFKTDIEFRNFFKKSDCFVNLLEKCGDRVVRIENNNSNDGQKLQDDNCRLLEIIEIVSDRGGKVYQYSCLDSHKKVLNEYAEKHQNTKTEIDKHLENITKNLKQQFLTDNEAMKADNTKLKKDVETLKVDNDRQKKDQVKLLTDQEAMKANDKMLEKDVETLKVDNDRLKDQVQLLTDQEALKANDKTLEKDIKTLKVDNERLEEEANRSGALIGVAGTVATVATVAGVAYMAGPAVLLRPEVKSFGAKVLTEALSATGPYLSAAGKEVIDFCVRASLESVRHK